MNKISIDDLPKYSPWVGRLLGLEPFTKSVRNMDKIDAEYDKEKYAGLLADYKQLEYGTTVSMVKELEIGILHKDICISTKGQLLVMTNEECLHCGNWMLIDAIAEFIDTVDTVVELGCGYGYNLSVLSGAFHGSVTCRGGEYSQNAVKLASLLFAEQDNISVQPFNWYDEVWPIFDEIGSKAIVFTRHSIEQLPFARDVLPTFERYKDKIAGVIHLEPVYELASGESLLDMMRRSYTRLNDYNTDLLGTLNRMNVKIIKTKYDLFGANPLNPTSLIYWEFP